MSDSNRKFEPRSTTLEYRALRDDFRDPGPRGRAISFLALSWALLGAYPAMIGIAWIPGIPDIFAPILILLWCFVPVCGISYGVNAADEGGRFRVLGFSAAVLHVCAVVVPLLLILKLQS